MKPASKEATMVLDRDTAAKEVLQCVERMLAKRLLEPLPDYRYELNRIEELFEQLHHTPSVRPQDVDHADDLDADEEFALVIDELELSLERAVMAGLCPLSDVQLDWALGALRHGDLNALMRNPSVVLMMLDVLNRDEGRSSGLERLFNTLVWMSDYYDALAFGPLYPSIDYSGDPTCGVADCLCDDCRAERAAEEDFNDLDALDDLDDLDDLDGLDELD